MTSIADAGRAPRWVRWPLWIALALSLTLNICFVGGLLWSKMRVAQGETPQQRMEQLSRELHLTPQQSATLHEFGKTIHQRTRLFRESNDPLVEHVWHEMAQPTPDRALISRLVEQAADNRQAYQKDTAAALENFMAGLTPEQRAQLADFAARRRDQMSRRLWQLVIP